MRLYVCECGACRVLRRGPPADDADSEYIVGIVTDLYTAVTARSPLPSAAIHFL
jgi:hypothetical protein